MKKALKAMIPRECWLCGRNGNGEPLELHHIFGGANRKKSEQYGACVYLCANRCHRNGPEAVHRSAETNQRLHEWGQRKLMEENGCPEYILLFRKLPSDISTAYADEPVSKSKEEYTRAQWQIDAHGFWRSSGDRLPTKEELMNAPVSKLQAIYADTQIVP